MFILPSYKFKTTVPAISAMASELIGSALTST